MFGKDKVEPINLDRVPNVSPEVAQLVADADPEVLRQALEDIAMQRRLSQIDKEIHAIGDERNKLHARASVLKHERETLLGEKLSAVPKCVA